MHGVGKRTVCVFCASSVHIEIRYLELATAVGTRIADLGWTLVSGAGSISMMGAVAASARAGGAWTIGVIPEGLMAWEVADHEADELVITRDMRQRKGIMDDRSDAFLVLPGGIGTLEEFIEAWTGQVLRMHAKPVVVLDPWDDYAPLRTWIADLTARGFVSESAAGAVVWTRTMDEAFAALEG